MKHRSRPRVLAFALVAAAAVVAPFVIYVGGRLEIVQTGYGMDRLDDRLRALEQENRALRLELARLADFERIRAEATRLGLQPLPLARLVVINPPTAAEPQAPVPQPEADLDGPDAPR